MATRTHSTTSPGGDPSAVPSRRGLLTVIGVAPTMAAVTGSAALARQLDTGFAPSVAPPLAALQDLIAAHEAAETAYRAFGAAGEPETAEWEARLDAVQDATNAAIYALAKLPPRTAEDLAIKAAAVASLQGQGCCATEALAEALLRDALRIAPAAAPLLIGRRW